MDSFLCGGISSMTAICFLHPVDVVKTRLQFQGELAKTSNVKTYNSILGSIAAIFRHEGVLGLYRGIIPALLLQFMVTSTRFGIYNFAKDSREETDHLTRFGMSTFSAIISGFAGSPFYMLKTQFQVISSEPSMKVGTQHTERTLKDAILRIVRNDGILGFWKGLSAFQGRVVTYGSVQLACYDGIKQEVTQRTSLEDGVRVHILSSLLTSFAAVTALQPFDLIAVRLMNQTKDNPLYHNFRDCAMKVFQAEGLNGLFKGYAANYARMGPYTVLTFLFFEQYKKIYKQLLT